MLSKKVLSIFVFIIGITNLINAQITCLGEEVSIKSQEEAERFKLKGCEYVIGDINIKEVENINLFLAYEHITMLKGSIRIELTNNITVAFENLREINAHDNSALYVESNRDLKLSFGPKLRKVRSLNAHTYRIVGNGKVAPISVNDYNYLYLGARIRSEVPSFQIDFSIKPDSCSENFFKSLSIIIGFLGATLATGLIIVGVYGKDVTNIE